MSEIRFGNKSKSKATKKSRAVGRENGAAKDSDVNDTSSLAVGDLDDDYGEDQSNLEYSTQNDLMSFVNQKVKEKEEVPMRQVMFRIPMPLWHEIKKKKGDISTQKLYATLSEYYINQ